MRLLCFALITTFSAGSLAQESLSAENLLQPLPLPLGDWETFAAKDRSDVRWIEKSDKEMVQTTIARGKKFGTNEFRDFDDSIGKRNCETFETTVISEARANGYEALLWKTTCKQKSRTSVTLARFISGNDASYIVRKSWLYVPAQSDLDQWLKYLQSVSACDTRSKDHGCPSLEKP